MALPWAAIALGTSVLSAYNSYQQGQAQAAALEEQARLDRNRADEYLLRTEKNIIARKKQIGQAIGGQKVALAEAGIELGSGVSLDILEDSYLALAEEEELMRDEAEYQAMSIRAGADAGMAAAKDASTAGTIQGITTILGSVANYASSTPTKGTVKGIADERS